VGTIVSNLFESKLQVYNPVVVYNFLFTYLQSIQADWGFGFDLGFSIKIDGAVLTAKKPI
jgi:hypothetical protein